MPEEERGAVERLVLVDVELAGQFDLVEGRLLAPLAESGAVPGGRPGPAAACPAAAPAAALGALRRLRGVVSEAVDRGPRVWAPNGRWEHAGLRLVRLPVDDVDLLYAVLRELSAALAAPDAEGGPGAGRPRGSAGGGTGHGGPGPLLDELAAAAGETPAALVGALARVLAAVDLVPDADTALLARALRAADRGDVRLTADEEEAWQRLAHRVTMVLTESVPLHRFLG
ncbi:hypothetical protein [Streptomyces sp. NPDC001380]|uniref:hypothetical protein n=1 Tax=Streptomyces sp. NPDC001380 TaxID=3364566 RepID=UPI0036C9DC67